MVAGETPGEPCEDVPGETPGAEHGGKGAPDGAVGDVPGGTRYAALGRHLRELRKRRGWTQERLAEKSGISEVTIRGIEADYANVRRRTKSTLGALSQALGLPRDYLSGYRDRAAGSVPVQPGGRTAPPPQFLLEVISADIREATARLVEVGSRLEAIKVQLDILMETYYPGGCETGPEAAGD